MVTFHDFASKTACEAAKTAIDKQYLSTMGPETVTPGKPYPANPFVLCVPKS
jgi:hypothetical protein